MEVWLLTLTLLFYLLSTASFIAGLLSARPVVRMVAPSCLLAACICHAGAIAVRSVTVGYFAVTDVSEALSFFAWLTAGMGLLVQWRLPVSILGVIVSPIGFMLTLGVYVFYTQARALPPTLQSAWLPIHVTAAFLGHAIFVVACSASLVYLVQEKHLKQKKASSFLRRLPSLETLDHLNYRSLAWGFLLLTLGLLSGAVWAGYAWGHFWIWEPRLILSVLTWILYALLLHYRSAGWRGRRAATLTIVCFAVLVISFVGVQFFPGRHGGQFG